jgi:O-antigen/teichoic acid export membrane protein
LKFGVPLIPHAIGGIMFTAIDRVFLTEFYGVEQTGNYSVSYQLGAIVSLLTFSFNNAFVPWLYQNLSNNNVNSKIKIVKFTYFYFITLAVFATFFLLIFPYIVIYMVDKSYKSINSYSVFIVYGFVFQGMYYMVTNYITFAKKTLYQSIITFFVALLKLPITYFSLLFFGISGASISFCFTFFIFFILTWIVSHKVYPMPWFLKTNI